jgi:guanylate kinase
MNKAELEKQQKYYLQQILLTVCGGKINLETYKFNRAFIVCGWTGCGKDTLIDNCIKDSKLPLTKFIRTLTRAGRPGEAPAGDAFFVKPEFFNHLKENQKFFYSYEKFFGDQFGYSIMHLIFLISRGHVLMVGGGEQNMSGLVEGIHNVFPEAPITTLFINRPKEEIIAGIRARGGDGAEIEKRVAHIEKNWKPKPQQHFDHIIWNEDMEDAKKDFAKAIEESLGNPTKSE